MHKMSFKRGFETTGEYMGLMCVWREREPKPANLTMFKIQKIIIFFIKATFNLLFY